MAGNTFGTLFRVTTFGESHGEALGCVIDGCPSGIQININTIQKALDRRRPGYTPTNDTNVTGTTRKEPDTVHIVSGIFNSYTTGTPICLVIYNTSQKSSAYDNIKDVFRPGHADYTYFAKYGIRDYRGGGRASGRETAARVAAGAVAKAVLDAMIPTSKKQLSVVAYTKEAAGITCSEIDELTPDQIAQIEQNQMRAPDAVAAENMLKKIEELKQHGESAGGIVECRISGVPAGLGEPVFDKLDAVLAHAMLSIGAVKGIEFGAGFESARMTGSTSNDPMRSTQSLTPEERASAEKNIAQSAPLNPLFKTNNAGGILGGISNGNDIVFRVAVKPVPSIYLSQQTIDTNGENKEIRIEGRHDICICPRIVPVVEAMSWITLADFFLHNLGKQKPQRAQRPQR